MALTGYQIRYRSAFTNRSFGPDPYAPVDELFLIAPSSWAVDEVVEAFLNQRPGSTVLTCMLVPFPDTNLSAAAPCRAQQP
jgi:hypothetical protein